MAAGWHGSYRDNGSRFRESSDVEVSKRKDHYQDRYADDDNRQRSRSRESRDASGGASGSGMKRGRLSGRLEDDREPGELSSGSGSDDPELVVARGKGGEGGKKENGDSFISNKKRKFSPIIWDLEDGKGPKSANSMSKNERVKPPVGTLPPPPPLPHGYVPTGLVRQPSEHASPLNTELPVDLPQDQRLGEDRELGQLEDEEDDDYVPARNISTSRWADGNNALDDDEAEPEEIMPEKRGAPLPNSTAPHPHRKTPSPEFDKVSRQGSGGAGSRSSSSEGEHRERRQEVEVDKKEYMDVDIDGDEPTDVVSEHLSDTDSEDSSDSIKTLEPENPPSRSVNMLQGCRSVDEFERLNKIDEGTYGVVYRAKDKKSGEIVALKKVKMEKEREGFPLTSLREINILLSFHHPSIVDVKEVVVGSSLDSIFMVMEYMEHDLKALMETMKQPFSQSEVKCLMLQLLDGVKYLHDNWVLHRDLKTSNLLLNNRGELKICDFGLSRQYGIPLKPYTQLVVTLWYRAPELLLGAKGYSTAIDMWSLGCIMAELLAKEPLFSGKTEFDQLDKIFRTLGTPNEKIWPGFSKLPGVKVNFVKQPYNKLREKFPPTSFSGRPTLSEAGFDLLNKLLTYDPEKRITAKDALNHNWFREVPLPKSKDFMPTFPAQHAQDRRLRRMMKSPDPLEEQRRKELQQGSLGTGSLFG